jgi:hypothetical protein
MVRRPAPAVTKPYEISKSYPLWISPDLLKTIEEAHERSPLTWPEWVSEAIKRFEREPQEEIDALLNAWVRGRAGKVRTNIRITDSTNAMIDEICKRSQGGTKQACLQHALFIHALRSIE